MLPLFVWHIIQLFLGSWIAPQLHAWSNREQRRLGISSTEDDDDEDDASEIGDDGHFVVDEESLVSSINGSHVSFATSANDTSQNSEIVRAPKTSKVFNTQAAAVEAAKAREAYARIIEDKGIATKVEEDSEVAVAERVDAPSNSNKKTMIPHDNVEVMVNSRGAPVDTEDGNSAQVTANSSQNPSLGKSEKSKRRHNGCHSDHRCYEVGVVYEAIDKPLDLLVMNASHQQLIACSDCAMKVGSHASGIGVRTNHGFPVYVCRECLNHLVCNKCWRRSKVPGWANHLFDMYF